jgi:predicted  nucleic acid-binding Zn-ribbon protein
MATPRRQLIRPMRPPDNLDLDRQIQRLRSRLEAERRALARWFTRLKRAFNSVMKIQHRVARIEKQIAHLEQNHVERS